MAFSRMQASGELVRDSFPGGVAVLIEDEDVPDAMPAWKVIPITMLDLADWACIGLNPFTKDMSRQLCLLHKPDGDAEYDVLAYFPVEMHIYAFVRDLKVCPAGNWTGKVEDAHKAVQYITLHGGSFPAQFESQKQTISHILALIDKYLDPKPGHKRKRDEEVVFLQRHPFSKVPASTAAQMPSVLTVADDPLGLAREVEKHWRVTSKVSFEYRTEDGETAPLSYVLLGPGDFVDATITFDIAYSRRADHMPVPHVHLGFERVVRLCAAEDVEKNLKAHAADREQVVQCGDAYRADRWSPTYEGFQPNMP